jgi:hypothetical protein
VAAAPAHFGIGVKPGGEAVLEAPPALVETIRKYLGEAVVALPFPDQLAATAKAGMTELPKEFALQLSCFPEYQSCGLMPALDCIAVLADLLGRFPLLRRDRLHCFGSSYGGYVACLVLKLMPNSFHVVIDNSGFTTAQPAEMANHEFDGYHWNMIGGLRVPIREASPWTFRDPASPRFAGPAVMAIRDCTLPDHFAPSKSLVRSYHSTEDKLIPIAEKRKFWTALGGKAALRADRGRAGDARRQAVQDHGPRHGRLADRPDGRRDGRRAVRGDGRGDGFRARDGAGNRGGGSGVSAAVWAGVGRGGWDILAWRQLRNALDTSTGKITT